MKSLIFLSLFVACLAAPATHQVDWEAVNGKVGEVAIDGFQRMGAIKQIAEAENSAVGSDISLQVDGFAYALYEVLAPLNAAVADQTLTVADATMYHDSAIVLIDGFAAGLQDELAQISDGGAAQINEVFAGWTPVIREKFAELVELLE